MITDQQHSDELIHISWNCDPVLCATSIRVGATASDPLSNVGLLPDYSFYVMIGPTYYRLSFQGMVTSIISILAAVTLLVMTNAEDTFEYMPEIDDDKNAFQGCPLGCQCSAFTMVCDGIIPETTPNYTTDLYLTQLPPSHLVARVFCNVSWENVKKLTISYDGLENDTLSNETWIYLHNEAFWCLNQTEIRSLHIDISWLHGFRSTSFGGLENITELDFSGCVRMGNDQLMGILTQNMSFPKLSKVRLSEVGALFKGLSFTQAAANGLANRNVTYIDVSKTEVTVPDTTNLTGICETLTELNVSYTTFIKSTVFRLFSPCEYLRVIEASGIQLPRLHFLPNMPLTFRNASIVIKEGKCPQTLTNIRKLIANRVAAFPRKTSICLLNCTVTIECKLPVPAIEEIQAREYDLPCLDVTIIFKTNWTNHLKYLDISNNGIETVNPHILNYLDHLIVLDVSENNLGQMPHFGETFSVLFQKNLKLEEIRLRGNRLENLPTKTFLTNTKLKDLYLSRNKIRQVTFDISKLKQLRMIDLRNNSVEYLDENSVDALDELYNDQVQNHYRRGTNSTFVIDLRGNPFICSCKALHFLNWFINSPLFKDTRHEYHCQLNDEKIPMNEDVINVAIDDCEKPIRRRRKILLSSILPFLALVFFVITVILIVKRQRKKKYYRRLDDRLDMIHENRNEYRFPVFLSYSSEDSNFVTHHVLQQLQVKITLIIILLLISKPGSTGVQMLDFCCYSVSLLVLLLSTHTVSFHD